ncbi:hypothetical protein ACP70R_048226 [Stipagrostis hirtigluma subsp. patula]
MEDPCRSPRPPSDLRPHLLPTGVLGRGGASGSIRGGVDVGRGGVGGAVPGCTVRGAAGSGCRRCVVLPLDTVGPGGQARVMAASLMALQGTWVEGVMVEERERLWHYAWEAYAELIRTVERAGLPPDLDVFHQCGGNVGDFCKISCEHELPFGDAAPGRQVWPCHGFQMDRVQAMPLPVMVSEIVAPCSGHV